MHKKNKRTPRAGQTDQLLPKTQLATVLLHHFYSINRFRGVTSPVNSFFLTVDLTAPIQQFQSSSQNAGPFSYRFIKLLFYMGITIMCHVLI